MSFMLSEHIFGFKISVELLVFLGSLVLTFVLLIVLLAGLAGGTKRERKYIKKASENNAKIPVKVTMPLPGSGEFVSAEIRSAERITDRVQKSEKVKDGTEIMPEVSEIPNSANTHSPSAKLCANCGSAVTGKFCAKCGTKTE